MTAAWTEVDGMKWRALTPFGVEIAHDLRGLTPEAARRFVSLFHQFGLIVARGQQLSMDHQTALAGLLGPILRRPGESGYLRAEGTHVAARSEYKFHADAAYTEQPFDALSLHAVDVMPGASGTRFANAERAYATLPPDLRDALEGRTIDMICPPPEALAVRACDQRNPLAVMQFERAPVVTNPRSGRQCLLPSELHAARVTGLPWEEGRALLTALYDHLYAPENTTEHLWHNGDLVIWDNLTYQHARRSLERAGQRVLQRVLVGTESPQHTLNFATAPAIN